MSLPKVFAIEKKWAHPLQWQTQHCWCAHPLPQKGGVMTAERIELVQMYANPPSRIATLYQMCLQLKRDCDALHLEITRTILDPSWMVAHFEGTEGVHQYAGDENP